MFSLVGKSDSARRFLAKATSLDRLFGPAWLAYGHSFAIESEHDQAMAAYFKASQLMQGYLVKSFSRLPQNNKLQVPLAVVVHRT